MSDDVYKKLIKVLDTLPNGFPETEEGFELKIVKHIFSPDEAEIFCDLKLVFETPEQIAERSGRPLEGLAEKLMTMWHKGEIMGINYHGMTVFKMVPWVFGIYEFQLKMLTKEFAQICEKYNKKAYCLEFSKTTPQLMQVIPIEEEIDAKDEQVAMPYEHVSKIIETGKSFAVNDCICKKEMELLDKRCDKPMEVCLAIAPVPNFFDDHPLKARPITKEEAYDILKKSEEAGLVHMTSNYENGHFYICNCCGCCCGILKGINDLGLSNVVNNHYYATIDAEECVGCGLCADERCQIGAILEKDGTYEIIEDKCIGCGLCITTCPTEAIKLIRKAPEDIVRPPSDEANWYKIRGEKRGVDVSHYL